MFRLRASIATRLMLACGCMVAASFIVVAAVFYLGTVGVLERSIDGKIVSISNRLMNTFRTHSMASLSREITRELTDGIDSDTEIFLLVSPAGSVLVGNLSTIPELTTPHEYLVTRNVMRSGRAHPARLLMRPLSNGAVLVVGRDLSEQESIQALVWRALTTGAAISLLLGVIAALMFRHQIEAQIGYIRRTALKIEAGDLTQRIPISSDDEFGLLNRDINRMLDRIEHLMDGIRHVSNAIAHDLRTPLSRIRSKLDDAVQHEMTVEILAGAAQGAIEGIDELTIIFEKLLQIAEAESGMRDQLFEPVDLNIIAQDMVDLYDATAEEQKVVLKTSFKTAVSVYGDRNLLASAVASLIDNAIKYAGAGAIVVVSICADARTATIVVRDNGPGIPVEELAKVTERFYRLDRSRSLPGNGLGLSIVCAIATLHGGKLILEDEHGLIARIVLNRTEKIGSAPA